MIWIDRKIKKIQLHALCEKFTPLAKNRLIMKRWKRISQENKMWEQAGVATFISVKADFKPKVVRRNGEVHYRLIKETIYQMYSSFKYRYTNGVPLIS
jgi:hypothetical protein